MSLAPHDRPEQPQPAPAFLKTAPLPGLVLGVGLPPLSPTSRRSTAPTACRNGCDRQPQGLRRMAPDGTVSIVCHRAEMGQGVRTSMPMIVADELEADWERVKVVQAPGDEKRYGNQDTDGSRSTRHCLQPMRRAAPPRDDARAGRRQPMEGAGRRVQATNHEVVHKTSGPQARLWRARRGCRQAAGAAARQREAEGSLAVPLHRKGQVNAHRRSQHRDRQGACTAWTCACRGMLYAVVARPPVLCRQGRSARCLGGDEGARCIKVCRSNGARRRRTSIRWVAWRSSRRTRGRRMKGREALKIKWDDGPQRQSTTRRPIATTGSSVAQAGQGGAQGRRLRRGLRWRGEKGRADYYLPHLAHATMEPPAASRAIKNGKCEIWSSIQSPQAARDRVAKRLGIAVTT